MTKKIEAVKSAVTATTAVTGVTVATAAAKEEAMAAFRAQLAGETCAYIPFMVGMSLDEVTKMPVNIVIAKNGLFRISKTPIGYFASKLAESKANTLIPGVQEVKEGVTLSIPKIPFELWVQVLTFYRDVWHKDKTEASLLFFWNDRKVKLPTEFSDQTPITGIAEHDQFIMYCPSQRNSGSLSEFGHDTMVPWLRANTTPLLETHSHHTMGAFWSGTDNANENMTQFYGVYGEIMKPDPKFLFRYVHGSDKTDISFYELFEKPRSITQIMIGDKVIDIASSVEYKGPWPNMSYPDDWMPKHTANSYVAPSYAGYGGGYGRAGTGGGYHYNAGAVGARGGLDEDYVSRNYRAGAAGQPNKLLEFDESKKNTVDGEDLGNLTNGLAKKTIETKTSTIEIVALQALSAYTEKQIVSLCEEMSDMGYDQVIHGTVKAMMEMSND